MNKTCNKCGSPLEPGFATAHGLTGGSGAAAKEPRLLFVVVGNPTSANPITALSKAWLMSHPTGRMAFKAIGVLVVVL
jgi:hypothetical protein